MKTKIRKTILAFPAVATLLCPSPSYAQTAPYPGGVVDFGSINPNLHPFAGVGNNVSILKPYGDEVIVFGDHGYLSGAPRQTTFSYPGFNPLTDAQGEDGSKEICGITYNYQSGYTDNTGFQAIDSVGHETMMTYTSCFQGHTGEANPMPMGMGRNQWLSTTMHGNTVSGGSVGGLDGLAVNTFTIDASRASCDDYSIDGLYFEVGIDDAATPETQIPIAEAMRVVIWIDGMAVDYLNASDMTSISPDVRFNSAGNQIRAMQDIYMDFGTTLQNYDISGKTVHIDYFAIVEDQGTGGVSRRHFNLDDPALIGAGCALCVPEPSATLLLLVSGVLGAIVRRRP